MAKKQSKPVVARVVANHADPQGGEFVNEMPTGTIGADVAAAYASADPASYTQRYRFDPETNSVVARQGENLPALMTRMQFEKDENGNFWGVMPSLATASVPITRFSGGPGGMDVDYFALWDMVDNNNDGKIDIRRAIRYYKTDAVAFRCVKLLAELANSRLNASCEDDQAAELISNWRKKAMPHSFVQSWFEEYFKVSWVVAYKTLIDYVPKDFKPNKIPRPGDDGNIVVRVTGSDDQTAVDDAMFDARHEQLIWDAIDGDEDAIDQLGWDEEDLADARAHHAQAKKTEQVLAQAAERRQNYENTLKLYEQAKAQYDIMLCSEDRLHKLHKAMAAAQHEWMKGQIPGRYTLLDPLLVDIEGPKEMPLLRQPFLNAGGDLVGAINAPTAYTKPIIDSLPAEVVEQVRRGSTKIWLSPNICNMTFGDKAPYERYPTPIMKRAFNFIENKAELVAMDKATARAVKERILLVKLGNDTFPLFDQNQLKAVQAMFNTPSKNMTLVWNHMIELEWVQPDLANLLDEKKYEVCDNQTRTAFGINKVLTGYGDSTGTVNALNFEGVKEIVDEAQEKFLEFLHGEVDMLRSSLSLSKTVTFSFDKLNLQDGVKFWAVLTQAVMNGIIDHQTALETLKFHFPTIVARMKKMKVLKGQGLFMPIPSANNLGPGGTPLPAKGGAPSAGKKGGRPTAGPGGNGKGGSSKAKPVKAKAKIQPVNDGANVAVVVDLPELDEEQTKDIVERFGVDRQWVMTRATYEEQFGKILMYTPYPDLTPTEAIACLRESIKLSDKIDKEVEKAVADWQKENGGGPGKRGPYATKERRDQFAEASLVKVLTAFMPKLGGADEDVLVSHFETVKASLEAADPEIAHRDSRIAASVICAKRYAKFVAAAEAAKAESQNEAA